MFFQEPIPDTSGYMIAGYAVAFIVLTIYVASMYIRNRNLQRDMAMLEDLEEPAATVKPKPKKPAKTVTKRVKRK